MGSYAPDLRNLEGTSIVETAQLVLGKLHAKQEHTFEEAEKEIAERIRHLDETKVSYKGLSYDLQKLEFNAKSAEQVMASSQKAIARAQALLKDNKQILATEKKKMEELEAIKDKVNKNSMSSLLCWKPSRTSLPPRSS